MLNLKTKPIASSSTEKERLYTIPELHAMAGGFPFTAVKSKLATPQIGVENIIPIGYPVQILFVDIEGYANRCPATGDEITLASAQDRIWTIHRPHDWAKMERGEFK